MPLIEVKSLTKKFGNFKALNNISLNFEANTHYVIRGSSGSGKSTLLYLIGGLDRPNAGSITINGKNLEHLNDEQLASYRNAEVGFVFQFHFLLASMNCLDNILLPSKIGKVYNSKLVKEIKHMAEELGVLPCLKKLPSQLSGGEQQRVNIIRALSLKPKILLCDEPTGNLDSENTQKVIELLRSVATQSGSSLIVVTHDVSVASVFENSYTMKDGMLS